MGNRHCIQLKDRARDDAENKRGRVCRTVRCGECKRFEHHTISTPPSLRHEIREITLIIILCVTNVGNRSIFWKSDVGGVGFEVYHHSTRSPSQLTTIGIIYMRCCQGEWVCLSGCYRPSAVRVCKVMCCLCTRKR